MLAPLFLPADRLDRLPKALAAGADALILDLEDGVAPPRKTEARAALARLPRPALPIVVRVNALGTPWHAEDVAMAASLGWAAIMQPKVEEVAGLPRSAPVWALIETAAGLASARAIAAAGVEGLVFGSVDFCADLGCAPTRDALLFARSELVLASRLAGLSGPVDGVSLALGDVQSVEEDAAYAASLGFSGKLCIHPTQVPAVKRGFAPSDADLRWAEAVLSAAEGGAIRVEGAMVDAPVRARARALLARRSFTP